MTFLGVAGVFARILFLPLPELAKRAQVIALVAIGKATPLPKPAGSQLPWFSHALTVERVLKGQDLADKGLTLELPDTSDPKLVEEDMVVLPPAGTRVLVFLTRSDDGKWWPVNEIQGLWPLETGTDKPCGAGTGQTLAQVEDAVRQGQ